VNKWFPKKYTFLLSFLNPKWIIAHFGRVNKWFPKKYPLSLFSFLNPNWIIAHFSRVNKMIAKILNTWVYIVHKLGKYKILLMDIYFLETWWFLKTNVDTLFELVSRVHNLCVLLELIQLD
jgi:hypothetical protein